MTKKEIIIMVVVGLLFWPFMIVYSAALRELAKWVGMP